MWPSIRNSVHGALAVLSLVAATVTGCSDPAPPDGVIICGPGSTCPVGYECGRNHCYKVGHAPAPLMGCTDYCNCMTAACGGQDAGFKDEGECLNACGKLSEKNLICRISHCVYAQFGFPGQSPDPVTHCPHAAGFPPCDQM